MKREFSFSDGQSNKFWNIEVTGAAFSVVWGKSGASGQTQTKSFADDPAAQSAADKLIAEKIKKGYIETGATSGAAPAASSAPAAPATAARAKSKKAEVEASESPSPGENADARVEEAQVRVVADIGEESRVLALDAPDYLWATWRVRAVQIRPEAGVPVFDKDEALQRLDRVPGKSWWTPDWDRARIAPRLSREEAQFWFAAMTLPMQYNGNSTYAAVFRGAVADKIAPRTFDGAIKREAVMQVFSGSASLYNNPPLCSILLSLFSLRELLEMCFQAQEQTRKKSNHYATLPFIDNFCDTFRAQVLPFLPLNEAEELRALLRPHLAPSAWPTNYYEPPHFAFHLGALLGMSDELGAVVASWKDDLYSTPGEDWRDHYHRPQEVVFGLASAGEVEREMRRLKLPLSEPNYVRAWLAHTEFSAPDVVVQSVLDARGQSYSTGAKDVADQLVKAFALAQAPEIAPAMLQLVLESKAPRAAREWLDAHPGHAIQGLCPVAAGRGKLADASIEWLRSLKKRGGESFIARAVETLPAEGAARLRASVVEWREKTYQPFATDELPEAIRAALNGAPKLVKTSIGWLRTSDLPPVTFGEKRLSDAQVEALLVALKTPAHPLALAVKANADRASLDGFAWKLFERWLGEGAPSKEKWAMLALGALGGDESALKLAPLVRVWPGEAQHGRAVTGLEVLRAIGTDTALMQINGIAQKVKFKGLQAKAVEAMEGIASDRGLSRAGLEDRVVPTLDLDENGTRLFDFGPRRFRVVLSGDLKPLVREAGAAPSKPRPDLPKPTSKGDAVLAENALTEWKLLKKQLAEAVKIQAVRLENAMVRGRRWTPDEFDTLLARHPLMGHLVRLLVWEAASGNRRATFRVVEDGTCADQNDEAFDLSAGEWAHIGIAHPLTLTEPERAAWGEIFSDYELVPPFAQLGRATYALEADEAGGKEITRFKIIELPPQTLCFGLEKLGWERGPALDGGGFYEHFKYFESCDVTACAVYEPGMSMGYIAEAGPQKITEAYFVQSKRSKVEGRFWDYPDKKLALALSEVDAVAVSETLKDLSELAAKGETK